MSGLYLIGRFDFIYFIISSTLLSFSMHSNKQFSINFKVSGAVTFTS